MREILPCDPAEAGPDTRNVEPPPAWYDYTMYAEEETCFARRRHSASTKEGRKLLIDAIEKAEVYLAAAKVDLNAR